MKKMFLISFLMFMFTVNIKEVNALDSLVEDAQSAILIEASTGQVLYEKNANKELEPASMTKMMTLNLILKAKEEGRINFADMHTVSQYAASMGGSQIYLEEGEEMIVEDLFKSIAIVSANDSAVALAERVAGNEANFVKLMNDEISKLGLKNTNFENVTGLPDSSHVSSAYDMAMIGRELLKYDDDILKYTSKYEDYIRSGETWLVNTNKLVKFVEGVDGLKTGWTDEAGYCLTATMNLNGIRVIAVLMGSSSSTQRNLEITQLMQYGVTNYELKEILPMNEEFDSFEDIKLKGDVYKVISDDSVSIVVKKGTDDKEIELVPKFNIKDDDGNYGELEVIYDGELIKTVNLVLDRKIEEKNFIELLSSVIQKIII